MNWAIEGHPKKWSLDVEYAGKVNDPNTDNGFTFRKGEAFMATLAYSQKGFGALVSTKNGRQHELPLRPGFAVVVIPINFIPAITQQHTYLAGTLYPYATVMAEAGASADLFYTIPKAPSVESTAPNWPSALRQQTARHHPLS